MFHYATQYVLEKKSYLFKHRSAGKAFLLPTFNKEKSERKYFPCLLNKLRVFEFASSAHTIHSFNPI